MTGQAWYRSSCDSLRPFRGQSNHTAVEFITDWSCNSGTSFLKMLREVLSKTDKLVLKLYLCSKLFKHISVPSFRAVFCLLIFPFSSKKPFYCGFDKGIWTNITCKINTVHYSNTQMLNTKFFHVFILRSRMIDVRCVVDINAIQVWIPSQDSLTSPIRISKELSFIEL